MAELSHTTAWLKLGHYRKTWRGGFLSEIDGPGFFYGVDGRRDPEGELAREIEIFAQAQQNRSGPSADVDEISRGVTVSATDDAPECRSPARFQFLRRYWPGASAWRLPDCPRFQRFRDGIAATTATLVFSSHYLNNPSSAFGHTFVRLGKSAHEGRQYPLLDYGIGFAADGRKANPFLFAFGGLLGWLPGEISSVPYYFKVQEYNDFESRDLWEYDLNLSPVEVAALVAHFWELGNAKISYKYLSANCSSLLLTAIEAAAPRLELASTLPYWVIPSDTVHAIFSAPGFVTATHYRPSKRSLFNARFASLAPESRSRLIDVAKSDDLGASAERLTGPATAAELDTLMDYFDFRHFKELARDDEAAAKNKQAILVARSRFPPTPVFTVPAPESERPEAGHGSTRANVGAQVTRGPLSGERADETRLLIGRRFALHDHLDPQIGFPRDSEIRFLDFLFAAKSDALRIEHAYAFAVKSSAPFETLLPNVSWAVRIGAERTLDESCASCTAGVVGAGAGYTVEPVPRLFATLLLSGDASLGDFGRAKVKLRLGPDFNLRAVLSPRVLAEAHAFYAHIFFQEPLDTLELREEIRVATRSRRFAFGLSVAELPRQSVESMAQIFFYY